MGAVAVRHDPASASLVRRMITQELRGFAFSDSSIDDVVLVASELVGNAVVHTTDDSDLDIGWTVDDTCVLLWVADPSPDVPQQRSATVDATSGRGLAIVAAVAQEWGVEPLQGGKRVWARVPVAHVA